MKPRYFFALAVVAAAVGLQQVIAHQHHASTLTATVVKDDQLGLTTTTQQQSLSRYVHAHMAVSEKFLLSGSFERAQEAASLAASPASDGLVYAYAQAACASHADSITQANCVQAYVASHSTPSVNPQAVVRPVKATYTKTLAAPGWTPDSAGIAFLVMLVMVTMGGYLKLLRR